MTVHRNPRLSSPSATRRSSPRRAGTTTQRAGAASLLTVLLWLCVLYFVFPLWWLFVSSTKDNAALFSTFGLWFAPELLALGQPADAVHHPRRHLHALAR